MRSTLWRVSQCIAVVYGMFGLVLLTQAAALTNPQDRMTRQQISQGSIHRIDFTTPTGAMDSTDTVTFTFPSGFNLTNLTTSDFALYAGTSGTETSRSIGASPANGVWGVAVFGQTVVFTAPTNASGGSGISPGAHAIFVIGSSSSGVTDPSSVGIYLVQVGGTFGDTGVLEIPIRTSDAESISATIPSSSGGGGSGGGGGGSSGGADAIDGTPPSIFNVRAMNITTSSADIVWATDEGATSRVEYGTVSPVSDRTDMRLVTVHSIHLVDLTPSTSYVFRVTSVDGVGNTRTDPTLYHFSTLDPMRIPLISNLVVSSITDRSAVVSWDTDIEATSLVEYGLTTGYGSQRDGGTAMVRTHRILLEGLDAATSYHLRVRSRGTDGAEALSIDRLFDTLADQTPPSNPFGFTAIGGMRQVALRWTNPTDVDFRSVLIIARTDRVPTSPSDGRFIYQGSGTSYVDAGLVPATRYFYTIFAVDGSGNQSTGASADARTQAETILPDEPPTPPPSTPRLPERSPLNRPSTASPLPQTPLPRQAVPSSSSPTAPPARPTLPSGTDTTGTAASSSFVIVPDARASSTLPVPPILDSSAGGSSLSDQSAQPSVTASVESSQLDFVLYAGSGMVELMPTTQTMVSSLPGRPLTIRIPLVGLFATPQSGVLTLGGSHYLLRADRTGSYLETTFIPGMTSGDVQLEVVVELAGGRRRFGRQTVHLVPLGIVHEQTLLARNQTVLATARVELFRQSGNVWTRLPGDQIGQMNPLMTLRDGAYGYVVPNGRYQIRVSKDGYRPLQQEVQVRNNVVNLRLGIKKEFVALTKLIDPKRSVGENARLIGEQAVLLTEDAREVIQSPPVQQATQSIVAPTVVAVTAASTATAVTGFNLLNYLRFLLTQPVLLIGRRKRKKWGVVYNALSKQPIELAIVRLLNAKTRSVVQTRITDAQGRFSFTIPAGEYLVQVIKPGFAFPTKFLGSEREDGDFLDLYHGETVSVKESTSITPNVPLDPATKEETPKQVLRKAMLRKLQKGLSLGGVIVSVGALVIQPSLLMGGFIVFQVASYMLFKRLAIPPKPKEWGIVYNAENEQPIEKTIVRIFDKKFNKLLETQVTDKEGKYGFFAGKGLYYVTAEKIGFEKVVTSDLDFTKTQEAFVDQKLALKPAK